MDLFITSRRVMGAEASSRGSVFCRYCRSPHGGAVEQNDFQPQMQLSVKGEVYPDDIMVHCSNKGVNARCGFVQKLCASLEMKHFLRRRKYREENPDKKASRHYKTHTKLHNGRKEKTRGGHSRRTLLPSPATLSLRHQDRWFCLTSPSKQSITAGRVWSFAKRAYKNL